MQPDQPEAAAPEADPLSPDQILTALKEATDEIFTTMLSDMPQCEVSTDAADTPDRVDIEATVRFSGDHNGTVVLRCTADGAVDITRGLLMLGDQDPVELEDISDAIGECANMMSGSLKSMVLDPIGQFSLGIPQIETYVNWDGQEYCGSLAYQLAEGHALIEVWLEDPDAED